jgi:hypothetical protein
MISVFARIRRHEKDTVTRVEPNEDERRPAG